MNSGNLPSHHRLAWPTLVVMKELDRPAHNSEILDRVARLLQLSPEQIAEPLGKGQGGRTRLEYKLSWVRTLLKGIGAIERVKPAVWAVTKRGKAVTETEIANETASMLSRVTSS